VYASRLNWPTLVLVASTAAWVVTCSPSYRDISTPNGQLAAIQLANDYLTTGNCDAARSAIEPLVHSQYATTQAWLVYSSTFACSAGLDFPKAYVNLKNNVSGDVWSNLVKSDFSSGSGDGHLVNLDTASDQIRNSANPAGSLNASDRSEDANVYMIYIQAMVIATVISPLGQADQPTGHRTVAITNTGTPNDLCHVQVAVAMIADSLQFSDPGNAFTGFSNTLTSACGGSCPTNKSLTTCLNGGNGVGSPQSQGQLLINALNGQWGT
jgi:hypothetical protein